MELSIESSVAGKGSCRDGRYYVFDGQHTIAARKLLNGGRKITTGSTWRSRVTSRLRLYSP